MFKEPYIRIQNKNIGTSNAMCYLHGRTDHDSFHDGVDDIRANQNPQVLADHRVEYLSMAV